MDLEWSLLVQGWIWLGQVKSITLSSTHQLLLQRLYSSFFSVILAPGVQLFGDSAGASA